MPGVAVTTAVRTGPSGVGDLQAGQLFVVGEAERGPTGDAVLIRSFGEYTTNFGNYEAGNLYAPVKAYFEEGGSRCYVGRAVGAGAAAGTLDLDDSGATPTLRITAASVGDWSSTVSVAVLAPDVSGFKIGIYLNGVAQLVTRDLVDSDDAVQVINSSKVNVLVVAENLPGSALPPDPVAAAPLSAGDDGTLVGDDTEFVTALDALFDYSYGSGAVAAPGFTGSVIWNGLRDHAADNNRVALLAFAEGDAAGTVKSAAAAYYADADAKSMAFYYPYIQVPDPAGAGLSINISPETYAAAARTKAIQEAGGAWRPGAGLISTSSGHVQGLATPVDRVAGDLLDDARVNALRIIGGQVRVYGARSVSNDEANWRYISFQDTINGIVVDAERRLEDFVFSTIDSRGGLFGRIEAALVGILDPIRVDGGLYEAFDINGERVDPGYSVAVNDDNNTLAELASGVVNAEVGVRVSSVGDRINITITKSNLTASVV